MKNYRYNRILITIVFVVLFVGLPLLTLLTLKEITFTTSLFGIALPVLLSIISFTEFFAKIKYQRSMISRITLYSKHYLYWNDIVNIEYSRIMHRLKLTDCQKKVFLINISVVNRRELIKDVFYSLKVHCKKDDVLQKIASIENSQ